MWWINKRKFIKNCNSLKITSEKYSYDDIVECGYDLIEFQGCTDVIKCAEDYKEYCRLEYDEDSDSNIESDDDKDNVCPFVEWVDWIIS